MLGCRSVLLSVCLLALLPGAALAQAKNNVPDLVPGAPQVPVEHIKVHGAALEGSLEGDAADRDVLVFLPPGYAANPTRRYPVVYALHGYSIGAEQWSQEIHVPQTIAGAYGKGAKDMIVVLPDSKTVHNGSMYSSSVTTGDCCLSARGAAPMKPEDEAALAAVKMPEDSAKLGFLTRAQLASAAAWSPNPRKPPLYLDLPMGEDKDRVLAKWAANAPLAFLDQYAAGLKRYRAIALDVGDQDSLKTDTGKLHDAMDSYGIANTLEIYPGTHVSNVAFRFQDFVMPFFSKTLSFEQ